VCLEAQGSEDGVLLLQPSPPTKESTSVLLVLSLPLPMGFSSYVASQMIVHQNAAD
jgi:hypothetical protein